MPACDKKEAKKKKIKQQNLKGLKQKIINHVKTSIGVSLFSGIFFTEMMYIILQYT